MSKQGWAFGGVLREQRPGSSRPVLNIFTPSGQVRSIPLETDDLICMIKEAAQQLEAERKGR